MREETKLIIEGLLKNYSQLLSCRDIIDEAFDLLKQCYTNQGKVMVCGNGGSAADSEHIVGELMKGFMKTRKICDENKERLKAEFPEDAEYLSCNLQGALPAISLVSQSAVFTAFINDVAADMIYAQQVYGYGKSGDVLIGISTSGNSKNVVNAIKVAKAFGIKTLGLTGETGGMMDKICDVNIKVPAKETYRIQEYHLPIYHALCAMLEEEFFNS
jgi:phosphoheptose isomerase